ncbi:protein FRA10AC1 homolog [Saccostrea echinata]|uniref:protein FRA10AC1 homolog n=1 Tax=Saccostrea echinata TaxID=191078 RepID=UPI002A7F84E3|nr:protein FRA10AC1 homolog [Saccostrea echinata]
MSEESIDFSRIHTGGGYTSDFDSDAEKERRSRRHDLVPERQKTTEKVANKRELEDEYGREEGKIHRMQILSMDAYTRHKKYVNDYIQYYGGSEKFFKRDNSKDKTDMDVIKEHHKFLWNEDEADTWEKRLAKKYYDKLFKEYCITDLSRYKENKVAMRWRTEKEVVEGKGHFSCGNRKCNEKNGLRSWEVNFAYVEDQEKKNALVKLRLCPDCSYKLNYHHKKKEILPKKKKKDKQVESSYKKHKSHHRSSSETEDTEHPGGSSSRKKEKSSEEEKSLWSGPAKISEEKSREEEFEDYFEDMFL